MKIHGRLTWWGEFLMHDQIEGLVTPAPLYLASSDESTAPPHPTYSLSRDSTWPMVRDIPGVRDGAIRGTLPLGQGFASSSVLAFLRLTGIAGLDVRHTIDRVDHAVHGFPPSGVDSSFCYRQRAGLFMGGRWRDCPPPSLQCAVVLFGAERKLALTEVRSRVQRRAAVLVRHCELLNAACLSGADLHEPLLRHAQLLLGCQVYSQDVVQFVEGMVGSGLVAKGIGGLYDKAILLAYPSGWSRTGVLELCERYVGIRQVIFQAETVLRRETAGAAD